MGDRIFDGSAQLILLALYLALGFNLAAGPVKDIAAKLRQEGPGTRRRKQLEKQVVCAYSTVHLCILGGGIGLSRVAVNYVEILLQRNWWLPLNALDGLLILALVILLGKLAYLHVLVRRHRTDNQVRNEVRQEVRQELRQEQAQGKRRSSKANTKSHIRARSDSPTKANRKNNHRINRQPTNDTPTRLSAVKLG